MKSRLMPKATSPARIQPRNRQDMATVQSRMLSTPRNCMLRIIFSRVRMF